MAKLWRHIKSDNAYWEVGRGWLLDEHGARVQAMVVYKEREGEKVWIRDQAEFDDGRFELMGLAEGVLPVVYPLHGLLEADLRLCVIEPEGFAPEGPLLIQVAA